MNTPNPGQANAKTRTEKIELKRSEPRASSDPPPVTLHACVSPPAPLRPRRSPNLPGLAARSGPELDLQWIPNVVFQDPTPGSEAQEARKSGNTQRACTCRTNVSFVATEGVEIISAGTKCSYVGGVSAGELCDHSLCVPVKLTLCARYLYEAALAKKKGFVIKEKMGHNGLPFMYVEVQMWKVEWEQFDHHVERSGSLSRRHGSRSRPPVGTGGFQGPWLCCALGTSLRTDRGPVGGCGRWP